MGILDELDRYKRGKRTGRRSFLIEDGTRYYFEVGEAWSTIFMHAATCGRCDYKREPRPKDVREVLVKLSQAKDREKAVRMIYPSEVLDGTHDQGGPFCAFDLRHLVETGELVPRLFAASSPPVEVA